MLGFIKKDLLTVKSNLKFLLIVFVIFIVMYFYNQANLSFLPPYLSIIIMFSSFSYDQYNKWDAYAITLPQGRRNVVRSKYLTTIILVVLTCLIVSLVVVIGSLIKGMPINPEEILGLTVGDSLGVFLVLSIMYPIIFKFGIEKARLIILVGVFSLGILGSLAAKFKIISKIGYLLNHLDNSLLLISLLIILFLALSYLLSQKIYSKKEF